MAATADALTVLRELNAGFERSKKEQIWRFLRDQETLTDRLDTQPAAPAGGDSSDSDDDTASVFSERLSLYHSRPQTALGWVPLGVDGNGESPTQNSDWETESVTEVLVRNRKQARRQQQQQQQQPQAVDGYKALQHGRTSDTSKIKPTPPHYSNSTTTADCTSGDRGIVRRAVSMTSQSSERPLLNRRRALRPRTAPGVPDATQRTQVLRHHQNSGESSHGGVLASVGASTTVQRGVHGYHGNTGNTEHLLHAKLQLTPSLPQAGNSRRNSGKPETEAVALLDSKASSCEIRTSGGRSDYTRHVRARDTQIPGRDRAGVSRVSGSGIRLPSLTAVPLRNLPEVARNQPNR